MDMTLKMLLEHYESPGERLTPDGHPVVWVNADDLADMIALARAQESQLAAANERAVQAERERDEARATVARMTEADPRQLWNVAATELAATVIALRAENARLRDGIRAFLEWENSEAANDRTTKLGLADWLEQTERLAALASDAGEAQGGILDDGFGNQWPKTCPDCGEQSMQIVRPGKVQCANGCAAEGGEA